MKNPESVDISLVRNINSRAVLDSIFNSDITSRTILAKQLGMSKSSVSSNLAGLIERGIVLEIGEGKSSVVGGRKPQLLRRRAAQIGARIPERQRKISYADHRFSPFLRMASAAALPAARPVAHAKCRL